ncbi:Hypothetical predicted protein, partial [Paramuricea clavata]
MGVNLEKTDLSPKSQGKNIQQMKEIYEDLKEARPVLVPKKRKRNERNAEDQTRGGGPSHPTRETALVQIGNESVEKDSAVALACHKLYLLTGNGEVQKRRALLRNS